MLRRVQAEFADQGELVAQVTTHITQVGCARKLKLLKFCAVSLQPRADALAHGHRRCWSMDACAGTNSSTLWQSSSTKRRLS